MLPRSNTTQPCGKAEPYLENIPYSHGGEKKTILSGKKKTHLILLFTLNAWFSQVYMYHVHDFRVLSL